MSSGSGLSVDYVVSVKLVRVLCTRLFAHRTFPRNGSTLRHCTAAQSTHYANRPRPSISLSLFGDLATCQWRIAATTTKTTIHTARQGASLVRGNQTTTGREERETVSVADSRSRVVARGRRLSVYLRQPTSSKDGAASSHRQSERDDNE